LLRGGVAVSMAVHGGVLCKDGGVTTAPRTWTKIWSQEEEDGVLQMQHGRNWCRCCFDVDGVALVKVRSWWPTMLQWWLAKHGVGGCSPSRFSVQMHDGSWFLVNFRRGGKKLQWWLFCGVVLARELGSCSSMWRR